MENNVKASATSRVFAIGRLTSPQPAPNILQPILKREVPETLRLYVDGKIDQWYARRDGTGVVFLVNVKTVEEAHALLEQLPLGQAGLMTFDFIEVGPLEPLRTLLHENSVHAPA